ncbi:hypothetical protein GCM10010329_74430 [Streptomyces spiroverticillatus]|nr:hypothetical protein GCM10010329_74430 [Streptomyces spiroverticillatus]
MIGHYVFSSLIRTTVARRITGSVVAAGAAATMILTGSGSASAASGANWAAVAACESGGNWATNTGNGYFGGLQFTQQTWAAYGGTAYASSAHQATQAQQIAVAEKVLAGQGAGAWGSCGAKGGLA